MLRIDLRGLNAVYLQGPVLLGPWHLEECNTES
jgi:hypothetical protein